MTREEFFTALANGAKWDVGVSIARTNPLPLDANSVFQSINDLEAYVTTNPLAYIGQIISVIGETEVAAYQITSVGENGVYVKLAASSASGDVAGDIAALQSALGTVQTDISDLKEKAESATAAIETLNGEDEGSVTKSIQDAITELDLANTYEAKGAASEVQAALDAEITRAKAAEEANATAASNAKNAADAAQADVNALEEKLGNLPEGTTDIITLIEESKYDDTQIKADIKANADAITILTDGVDQEKVDGIKDLIAYVEEHGAEVTGIKADIATNTGAIAAETARAEGIESGLNTRITALENYDHAADLQAAKDYADNQIEALGIEDYAKLTDVSIAKSEAIADAEGKIATAKQEAIDAAAADATEKVAAARGETQATVASVETSVANLTTRINEIVATGGEPNTINSIKVNGQELAISSDEKSVDITVPTKISDLGDGQTTLDAINAEIAKKVDTVENKSLVDNALIVKLENLAIINSVSTEFAINAEQLEISAIDASKITGLDAKINAIHSKVATTESLGLVLATSEENGIEVAENGAMSVHSLNVNKLTQTLGERLVLDGGTATI